MVDKSVIDAWDQLTNPIGLSFVPQIDPIPLKRKKTSRSKKFANTRYNAISAGATYFISPTEELNYSISENFFGERTRDKIRSTTIQ
jgi:hypothetical protein